MAVALAPFFDLLCESIDGCPPFDAAALQNAVFELPLITSCVCGLALVTMANTPPAARVSWGAAFLGVGTAAGFGVVRFAEAAFTGGFAGAQVAANHDLAAKVASLVCLPAVTLGAMQSAFGSAAPAAPAAVVGAGLSASAWLTDQPLLVHGPVMVVTAGCGLVAMARRRTAGSLLVVGVVLLAAGPEVAKVSSMQQACGLAEVDLLHVFLTLGLFCFGAATVLLPVQPPTVGADPKKRH